MALYPSDSTYPSDGTYPSAAGLEESGSTAPAGSKTWADVAAMYPTWQAIIDAGISSWDELFDNSGQRFTLVSTPEPDASPPRIRIDISDTRVNPVSKVTVYRRNPDGRTYAVRTSDAGPLLLSDGMATIYDYEPWYGAPAVYSTDVLGGPSTAATLDVDDIWLVHVGVPAKSVRLHSVVELGEGSRPTSTVLYKVMGREDPVPVSSGRRALAAGSLAIRTETDAERRAFDSLLNDDAPVFLNVPASLDWGMDPSYLALLDFQFKRTVRYGPVPLREWAGPYQVIGRPGGGTQAAVTWADVAAKYPTWAAIAAAGVDSWAELAAPTS